MQGGKKHHGVLRPTAYLDVLVLGCWDAANFLHSSWYGAMFWICAENSVDNTERFLLLLSRVYAETRPFLFLTPPASRLGVHKKSGGDTAGRRHSRDS